MSMYKVYSETIKLETPREGFIAITDKVRQVVENSGIMSGTCLVYCPHTTAGITLNENYDPDVATDLIFAINKAFPDYKEFRHFEGNSHAHMKASVMGTEQTVIIKDSDIFIGRWQGIYFCEFDGPRSRKVEILLQGI